MVPHDDQRVALQPGVDVVVLPHTRHGDSGHELRAVLRFICAHQCRTELLLRWPKRQRLTVQVGDAVARVRKPLGRLSVAAVCEVKHASPILEPADRCNQRVLLGTKRVQPSV